MDFTGQHVVVTGGSAGIGRAAAERIVAAGGTVTLIARRREVLEQTARALGPNAFALPCDVGVKEQLVAALDAAVARSGPIDGLFLNAASGGVFTLTAHYPDEMMEEVLRINVLSPFWAIRHAMPAMMARGKGAILVTGSLGGERGMAGNAGYCISKGGARQLAMVAAAEGAASGVRCNVITPGFIDTDMMNAAPDEAIAAMTATTPQHRIGRPPEAGAVAAFLLSDDASHVTAQNLAVDGGVLGTLVIR
jgi:NAD(P)-dependent dehydrogenase (short-subunit alcohol dehydrogenase family)